MKTYSIGAVLIGLLASVPPAIADGHDTGPPVPKVTGKVTLWETNSRELVKDASQVVVWLVPMDKTLETVREIERPHYRMLQHNKMLAPNLLVVPLGSVVDFPNLDPWFHNIFSLYRGKRFDLGLYQAGTQKSVRFDRPGPSFLFCNIHPQMTAVILTIESDLFGVSNKEGHISIAMVPQGKYVLHVWYEDATTEAMEALQRPILIGTADPGLPSISLTVTKNDQPQHKDKYGRDYDAKAPSLVY